MHSLDKTILLLKFFYTAYATVHSPSSKDGHALELHESNQG